VTAAAVESKPEAPRAPAPATAPPPFVAPPTIDPAAFTDDAPPFSAETLKILATPVDPALVETRAQGGRELQFVPWVHYQAVLLQAFGPGGYRLVPRGVTRTEGNSVTWTGALFVRAPGTTKFQFIKEAKGECNASIGANAAEGAQSDCLVKCCKGLGIFMELFDPSWRAAWEKKYRQKHETDRKAAQWPTARAAPAGAPTAAAPADTSRSATPAPTPTAPAAAAPAASEPPPADTGEAATAEQKDALRSHIREKKWMKNYVRLWFAGLFGDEFKCPDPLEALTQRQADAAYFLLLAHGKPMYEKLLADERAKGNVL